MTGVDSQEPSGSAVRSLQCWLGLDAAVLGRGWRARWAPAAFYLLAFAMFISLLRFFVNPLFSFENAIILLVLLAYAANLRRFRLMLAAPA